MASGGGGGGRRGSRRRKAKKRTKYLSLSRHLTKAVDAALESKAKALSLERSPPSALASMEEAVEMAEDGGDGGEQQQRLEAFALHPEAPSTLFAAAPSLTDILGASSSAGGGEGSSSCDASPDVSGGAGEEEDLARRALRGRERWVYCRSSSSSSPPSAAAATTTTTSSSCSSVASTGASARSPLLKLDYEEILAAWVGRGSLYIGAAAAGHAAPELELDPVFVEVGPSTRHVAPAGAVWSAPEMAAGRAERVRRYREKRQGRLFSKRIRYEVRRINAVRRPRLKGRFIKEKEEGVAIPDGGDLQHSS